MIKLKNINYIVENEINLPRTILKDISLSFPKNKITVITGQNGSGKSTLLKIIMGIISPTSGEIFFGDENITNKLTHDRANMGLSLAFQQPVRFKGIKVKDLLSISSKNKVTITTACNQLSKVGLCAKDYLDRELDSTLSGGEMKRIELASILLKDGSVLMFDEPEAGIDLYSYDKMIKLFKSLKNKTVIIVSHQKKLIEIADYVLLLKKQCFEFGTKEQMIEKISGSSCAVLKGENNE